METIKISPNVEFDVIYADGTRHHVAEGVLFEVKNNKLTFHNGTDRAAAMIGVAEAAAEVVGAIGLSEEERALIIYNIHKRLFGRKNAAADFPTETVGDKKKPTAPMTNADKIRSMTDEQLAKCLIKVNDLQESIPFCQNKPECDKLMEEERYDEMPCTGCMIDWLKQTAEVE